MSKFEDGSYQCLPGPALIAKILAGRCQMNYTRAAVGKGTLPEGVSPKELAEPPEYVMDAMIAEVSNPVDGECQVTVQINSSDVESGFYANYIILYAEDPDDGDVPYTCLKMEDSLEWIRPKSSAVGKLATFDLVAVVGDVDVVSAAIDPNAIVTVAQMERMIAEHDENPDAHSAAISDAVAAAIKEGLDGNTQTGEVAPGEKTPGVPGQHYLNTATGTEYVCTGTAEDGTYIWEVSGTGAVEAHNKDPNAHSGAISTAVKDFLTSDDPDNPVAAAVETVIQEKIESGEVVSRDAVKNMINTAGASGGSYSGCVTIAIPADGWALMDEPVGGYNYICDVAVDGVTADQMPIGGPVIDSSSVAQAAGMANGCETMDGHIRFYAARVPTADITATIALFVQDNASSIETGDGLTTSDDGKLTLALGAGLTFDVDGRVAVDTASAEDTADAISSVFDNA